MNDHRKDDQPDMVIVHRPSNAILVLAGIVLAIVLVLGSTFGVVALINSNRISDQEALDIKAAREAAYRQCARGNLTRAEIHVAYQQPPTPMGVLKRIRKDEPALFSLIAAGQERQRLSLVRVQNLNPILECGPNLRGNSATPLSRKAQERYVRRYEKQLLNPLPAAPVR